ncbi:unnamed protein product [Owenia fusiformis]|uniref:Uncharacterized protein n=1 Tax=Owenia fusiformis TaxID=6347 RepID=A0A8J1UKT3_OWEFU|nr:unnamed protein product [Owenia fusiformis]
MIFSEIFGFIAANPAFVAAVTVLVIFVSVLSIFLGGSKPGSNPFYSKYLRKSEPLVTDLKARDKVLKQGFVTKKLTEAYDAIVIGSGIGGLTTASLLSSAGKKVLVLEQHDQAGGCCHTFIDKGFEFDVGIHYIGEMRSETLTKTLITHMTDGQLQWVDLEDCYDIVALGDAAKARKYPIMSGRENFKKALIEHFPNEQKAIEAYVQKLRSMRGATYGAIGTKVLPKWIVKLLIATGLVNMMTTWFTESKISLQDYLDSLTTNDELKAVLAYPFGDYGTIPKETTFAMHAMLINHFLYGVSYPKGGASEIAFHMIPTIERNGGKVLVRAPVSKILTDSEGKATGVRVHRSSGDVDIPAPIIISGVGVINTLHKLLPREVATNSSLYKYVGQGNRLQSGMGCMSLFVGLNGTKDELDLKAQNTWAYCDVDVNKACEEFFKCSAQDAVNSEIPLLFISFPSTKDPTWDERYPGKSTCVVITLARWEWFEEWKDTKINHRGEDYDSVKGAIARRMWEQTCALYPQVADKVEYFDCGSPLSNNYYLGSTRGEIYGLDHNRSRFQPDVYMHLRPETEIPGLYLTGQDIFSCGFAGGMYGGLLCASKVLNRNLMDDLLKYKKQLAK